jgi:hypothetical protein
MRSIQLGRRSIVAAIAVSVGLVSAASADLSENVFTITATDSSGRSGSYVVDQSMGVWSDNGTFSWSSSAPISIWDSSHTVPLGILNPAGGTSPGSAITVLHDPQINLNFAVQAGGSSTDFTITSALLSFPTITDATGTASAGYSVSDLTGDGVNLNAPSGSSGAYLAQYNGFVPTGTTFFSAIDSVSAPAFSSNTVNDDSGETSVGTPMTDMSVQISFSLSAFDLASGTTTYIVTPEPGSLLMLAAGLCFAARRR